LFSIWLTENSSGGFELLILLALVRLDDEDTASRLPRPLKKAADDVVLGSVYVTLDRLEAKGIGARVGEPTAVRGGRAKTYDHGPRSAGGAPRAADADQPVARGAAA
jgi:DNA-binding PadR family transcriptional regulator